MMASIRFIELLGAGIESIGAETLQSLGIARRSYDGSLKALNEKSDKTILIIRHSERYSSEGVFQLTPKGVRMAQNFGKSIHMMYPDSKLSLYHAPATRCMMTAQYISEGHDPKNKDHITLMTSLDLGILNRTRYDELRKDYTPFKGYEGNYKFIEFNKRWVSGDFRDALIDSKQYANKIFAKMLKLEADNDRSTAIFVGHDTTLYPLIGHIFGIDRICTINYLEGLSFIFNKETVQVRFRDLKRSIKTEELIIE